MKSQDLATFNLPDCPGVYFFKKRGPASTRGGSSTRGGEILYVGKATSLSDRVKSYFSKDIFLTRGPKIVKMLEEANSVEYLQTDSVLEALILEANEIKKHQPIYNSREKDDKSYNYVVLTKEDFPKIIIQRGRDLEYGLPREALAKWGPFPHSGELREALKIVRKIFPYRDEKCKLTGKPCFNAQIGLCPGPCAGWISKAEYKKTVRNIKLFFEGRKTTLIKTLEREMKVLAKEKEFEKADEIKKKIFALDHIQDVALIKADLATRNFDGFTLSTGAPTPIEISRGSFRIEAYDIAHISGTNAVGVMTVVDLPAGPGRREMWEVNKSQYRKFKIKTDPIRKRVRNPLLTGQGNNDVGNLKQILERRFGHPEWKAPSLIVVDGGKGQINVAKSVLKELGLEMIEVASVVKDERHRAREILDLKDKSLEKAVLLANAEAHRFAIGYHRKLRSKGFRL